MKSLLTVVCFLLTIATSLSKDAEYDRAFDALVNGHESEFFSDRNDQLVANLLKHGTPAEFAASVRAILDDSAQMEKWPLAMTLATSANIHPKELLPWARDHLETLATKCDLSVLPGVRNILSYGENEDVVRLRQIAQSLPDARRKEQCLDVARRVSASIALDASLKPQTEDGTPTEQVQEPRRAPFGQNELSHPGTSSTMHNAPKSKSSPLNDALSSRPWFLWLFIIGAASGLLWLVLKRRS